jgi:ferritin-like metal-binding protein YciE
MSERQDTLQQYVSDMLAVERHILPAIESQSKEDRFAKNPEVQRLVSKIEATVRSHINGLEQHLDNLGGDTTSPIKSAATAILGLAATMIEKVRTDPVSKNLRDDYTVLNLAAVSYAMLHTTGQALMDEQTADLAATHLSDYTPLIAEINEVIPEVVVSELPDETEVLDPDAAKRANKRIQEAWDGDHVHSGHSHSW